MNPEKVSAELAEEGIAQILTKYGTRRKVSSGTVLLSEDEPIYSVPIVISGAIKVMRTDEEGHEILLYYIKPGESCVMSFLGATCNQRSKIRAIAEEDTEVVMLPVGDAVALIERSPQWVQFIFELYNKRFEELLDVVNAIAFHRVDERLLELLKRKRNLTGSGTLHITHQQLAQELGTAREVVSRLLKQLEKQGKIELGRNRIDLHPRL